jgi:hypothetical protein
MKPISAALDSLVGKKECGPRWSRADTHASAGDLFPERVAELEVIVPKDDFKGSNK